MSESHDVTPRMASVSGVDQQQLSEVADRMLTPDVRALYDELLTGLDAQAAALADDVAQSCFALIPEYGVLSPTDLPSVAQHVRQHLRLFVDCAQELRRPTDAELR